MNGKTRTVRNCEAIAIDSVPVLPLDAFLENIRELVISEGRVSALFGCPANGLPGDTGKPVRLFAVIAHDNRGLLSVCSTDVDKSYQTLTNTCPQVHWFEREIAEQWDVTPEGHPWLKPIRFEKSGISTADNSRGVGITNFFRIEGEEVHEVAVGPVHAGIIEPGHFRFQCYGENVYHLEISLGYQHRGIEKKLVGGPDKRTIHYMETLAGDTTAGHATAYGQAVEALGGYYAPPRALALRSIALELERLANHTGDLGALAGDIGYLPTMSFCGRLRGDFLNMTALLCGNRFGRGFIVPGGVGYDCEEKRVNELIVRLDNTFKDVEIAVELLWITSSVLARFEDTGKISAQACKDIGLVGPATRASGIDQDVRRDFPSGIYQFYQIPVSTWNTGDVFARALVRWLEIQKSVQFIRQQAVSLPEGEILIKPKTLQANKMVVSLVEGWRGEICHVAITGKDGHFISYKVVDPSFHNWFGLALALRNQQISDFPLCNKSFNLSYCGHDL